jgi:hypothetical protein
MDRSSSNRIPRWKRSAADTTRRRPRLRSSRPNTAHCSRPTARGRCRVGPGRRGRRRSCSTTPPRARTCCGHPRRLGSWLITHAEPSRATVWRSTSSRHAQRRVPTARWVAGFRSRSRSLARAAAAFRSSRRQRALGALPGWTTSRFRSPAWRRLDLDARNTDLRRPDRELRSGRPESEVRRAPTRDPDGLALYLVALPVALYGAERSHTRRHR